MNPFEQLRAALPEHHHADFDWFRDLMNFDRDNAIRFMGFLAAASVDLQHLTFWELVASCRQNFKGKTTRLPS